jgi:uncharacterized RDD family membrane protein YckC
MMNDSVREELQDKIAPLGRSVPAAAVSSVGPEDRKPAPRPIMPPPHRRTETSNLNAPKTSKTLVEFQTSKASVPEWRLQLQNAVRARQESRGFDEADEKKLATGGRAFSVAVSGAAAAPEKERLVENVLHEPSDPRVANALRRIAESRKTFLGQEPERRLAPKPPARSFPFDVVKAPAQSAGSPVRSVPPPVRREAPAAPAQKPKLVVPEPVNETAVDTNKLPPIDDLIAKPVEDLMAEPKRPDLGSDNLGNEFASINRIRIKAEPVEQLLDDTSETVDEEIEDLAPISMRFSAGLFDLIIGAFTTMLLLSPIAFSGGNWFSFTGLITFLGSWAVVMFVYMTACVGFVGKTMGMRLFSLELVDAVENEYPTLHQAAVNSCLFLISLALGGAGFLTVFFNEENRALHDLVSGTIIVREF